MQGNVLKDVHQFLEVVKGNGNHLKNPCRETVYMKIRQYKIKAIGPGKSIPTDLERDPGYIKWKKKSWRVWSRFFLKYYICGVGLGKDSWRKYTTWGAGLAQGREGSCPPHGSLICHIKMCYKNPMLLSLQKPMKEKLNKEASLSFILLSLQNLQRV